MFQKMRTSSIKEPTESIIKRRPNTGYIKLDKVEENGQGHRNI